MIGSPGSGKAMLAKRILELIKKDKKAYNRKIKAENEWAKVLGDIKKSLKLLKEKDLSSDKEES